MEINLEKEIKDSKLKALKQLERFFEEHIGRLENLLRLRNKLQLNEEILEHAFHNYFNPDQDGMINLEGTINGISTLIKEHAPNFNQTLCKISSHLLFSKYGKQNMTFNNFKFMLKINSTKNTGILVVDDLSNVATYL